MQYCQNERKKNSCLQPWKNGKFLRNTQQSRWRNFHKAKNLSKIISIPDMTESRGGKTQNVNLTVSLSQICKSFSPSLFLKRETEKEKKKGITSFSPTQNNELKRISYFFSFFFCFSSFKKNNNFYSFIQMTLMKTKNPEREVYDMKFQAW